MYQIVCDGYILHDPRHESLQVINGKYSLEVNKTGSLTFYIAPNHPYYDKINKHTSELTLYQDDKILFVGRVLNDEVAFENTKFIECEGELAYFIDSVQRGKEYHLESNDGNVIEDYLTDLVSIHNSQVDDRKKFEVGIVTVADPNNYLYKISNYENTLSILNDKLINTYGGHLMVRHNNGVRYLDYVHEFTNVCNQTIEFGKNIVDMTKYIKGEDIYTALIPLGAIDMSDVSESTYDKRIKITSVPDKVEGTVAKVGDYVYDVEAVTRWGWIWAVKKWDDVTVADNLYSKAKEDVSNSINESLTLELTAIDLHLWDVEIDRIEIGDLIRCVSVPHNIDTLLVVKSIDGDIDNPANTVIKLVSRTQRIKSDVTITSSNKDNSKEITDVKNTLEDSYPTLDDFDNLQTNMYDAVDDLRDWANDRFLPQGADGAVDLSEYAKITDVNTAFNTLANAIRGV